MSVSNGTYLIVSGVDLDVALDVNGASGANNANVQIYGINHSNAQIFYVATSGGKTMIRNISSGKCVYPLDGGTADKTNVVQNGSSRYCWVLSDSSTTYTINGTVYTAQIVRYNSSSGKAMDVKGASSEPKTNVQLYTANGTDAQDWIFIPYDALKDTLPTNADIRIGSAAGKVDGVKIAANGLTTVYPSWVGTRKRNDCRYRIRTRTPGESIGEWGNWKSIDDRSTANYGWGDVNQSDCITTLIDGRMFTPVGITIDEVDNTNIDYEELQIECRAVQSGTDYGFRGASSARTLKLIWEPTLTISAFAWTPEGMLLTYVSDYERGGNTIIVNSVTIDDYSLSGSYEFTNRDYTDSILIPVEDMGFIPNAGDTAEISIMFRTDVTSITEDFSATISYDTSAGITVSPTYAENDDYSITATVTATDSDRCFLKVGDSLMECDGEGGVFKIYPPLNTDYTLYFVSISGSRWGMTSATKTGPTLSGYAWNWDNGTALITYGFKDRPEMDDNAKIDYNEEITTGRRYPVYRFGNSATHDLTVTGVYMGEVDHNTAEDFDALLRAGHVIFRDPVGNVRRTAILSVKKKNQGKSADFGVYGEVTIEQREETI